MNCPNCQLIEMRVEKVENDEIHYKCKKCGKEIIEPIPKEQDE